MELSNPIIPSGGPAAMIRDRYDPVQLFALVPQLQLQFEPELAELDQLLDDEILFQQVKADLARRRPKSTVTGRLSTPVEVILRMLIIKHLHDWSYEATEQFVNDSLVLRQFCRLALEKAPDDTTLVRWANLIQPETLHRLLDRVTELARQHQVTRGRKLRTDSTVVETTIHHPSDSTLLADGIRVISRLVRRARPLLEGGTAAVQRLCRDRTRSAKQLARRIGELAVRGSKTGEEDARVPVYRRLLTVATASLRQAQQVGSALATTAGKLAQRLHRHLEQIEPLVERVIRQTERRVLQGQQVPASEKVVSLFEPHTALIRRGKVRQPTEFGRKVLLDEVDGGIVTRYQILAGNPPDAPQFPVSLAHHQERFARAPYLVAADRSFWSPENERAAEALGVRRVAIPRRGGKRPSRERERWFRRGHRFRVGIEGRISVLRRSFGLDRCRSHGQAGMERWVGLGILAHNLRTISRAVARKRVA
jgi:IS5 family transposase